MSDRDRDEDRAEAKREGEAGKKPDEAAPKKPPPKERSVSRNKTLRIDGEPVRYVATASTVFLRDKEDEPRAEIFSVAYVKEDADPAERPVTFAFNGGPGSSAVWLHLGTLGPRRVVLPDAAHPRPAVTVEDNVHSLLDVTDLVFVDPVGTGYSRALGKTKPTEFHDIAEDALSVGDFIRLWLTRNGRWTSPRFLAGESYGATRAGRLAAKLEEAGVALQGVMLVSSALQFNTFIFGPGHDLPYVLFLPSYAAVAAYHGVLPEPPRDLAAFLREARAFAETDYLVALAKGARLAESERDRIAERVAALTGLSKAYVLRSDLRIEDGRFVKELLRERGRVVGRLDARYTGFDPDPLSDRPQEDPSYRSVLAPYNAAVNDYLRRELGFEEDRRYEVLSMEVNETWRFHEKGRIGFPDTSADLANAMTHNPHLGVFFANGVYDLATPFFAIEYSVDHLRIDPALRKRIEVHEYEAGHMMYVHEPSLVRFKGDLARFIRGALARTD